MARVILLLLAVLSLFELINADCVSVCSIDEWGYGSENGK
jgi:hypothetical protein